MRFLILVWMVPGAAALGWEACAAEVEVESVVINLIAEAEVPAREAGALAEINVSAGVRVKAGASLARLDDRDAALEVSRAEIALEHATEQAASDVKLRMARQTLKLAELELKKAEDANKELARVVSPTQIEKLKIDVENAQLEIEQAARDLAAAERAVKAAKNELAIAQRAVERRKLVAPIDGIVVDVRRQMGEWLQPGDALVRIVRDDRLRAEGFVSADKLASNLVARPANLTVAIPGEGAVTFRGTVTFVSPEANPVNGQVRLWAEFDNRDGRLRPGVSAKMTVEVK